MPIYKGKLKDVYLFLRFLSKSLKASLVLKSHFSPHGITLTSKATDSFFTHLFAVNHADTSLSHFFNINGCLQLKDTLTYLNNTYFFEV